MAEERNEAPTPKRRREARRRGETPRSQDLTSAAVLLAGLVGLRVLVGTLRDRLSSLLVDSLVAAGSLDKTQAPFSGVDFAGPLTAILGPLFLLLVVATVAVTAAQGGLVVAPGLLAPKSARVNPLAGVRRLISMQGLVQFLRTLLKFVVIGVVGVFIIEKHLDQLSHLGASSLPDAVGTTLGICWEMAFDSTLALLAIGAADFFISRRRFLRSIRMSKQEVKEELRESEVDPQVRARLRRRREQLVREMMKSVRTADVVVTNPTHYAVALKYDPVSMGAPTVVAKGVDFLALRLREAAAEARVPVMANPPLARSLHRNVRVGQQIPADLYMAVAEVLAFVFRLRSLRNGPAQPVRPAQAPAAN